MTAVSTSSSRMSAMRACSWVASGVVSVEGTSRSPARIRIVPTMPDRRPRASSRAAARKLVVVLPLVPVTPSRRGPASPPPP